MEMHPTFTLLEKGDIDGVRTLLERDSEAVAARNPQGVSLLLCALYYRQRALAEYIEKHREDLDIFEASALGRVSRLEEILEAEPDAVGKTAGDGFTALHLAAFFGKDEAVSFLIGRGADVMAVSVNPMKVTALNSAVAGRNVAAVSALIEARADINARQQEGYTPLMGAASAGDERLLRILIEAGADPSLKTDGGETAMEIAVRHGHKQLIAMFE